MCVGSRGESAHPCGIAWLACVLERPSRQQQPLAALHGRDLGGRDRRARDRHHQLVARLLQPQKMRLEVDMSQHITLSPLLRTVKHTQGSNVD